MPQNMPNTFRPARSMPVLLNGASGVLAFAPCRKSRRTALVDWQWHRKGVPRLREAIAPANLYHCRYRYGRAMRPELVVLYIVAGAFTAALAGLTQPTGRKFLLGDTYFDDYLFAMAVGSLAGTVSFYRGGAVRALYLPRTCHS
jgi:hypothetical protein